MSPVRAVPPLLLLLLTFAPWVSSSPLSAQHAPVPPPLLPPTACAPAGSSLCKSTAALQSALLSPTTLDVPAVVALARTRSSLLSQALLRGDYAAVLSSSRSLAPTLLHLGDLPPLLLAVLSDAWLSTEAASLDATMSVPVPGSKVMYGDRRVELDLTLPGAAVAAKLPLPPSMGVMAWGAWASDSNYGGSFDGVPVQGVVLLAPKGLAERVGGGHGGRHRVHPAGIPPPAPFSTSALEWVLLLDETQADCDEGGGGCVLGGVHWPTLNTTTAEGEVAHLYHTGAVTRYTNMRMPGGSYREESLAKLNKDRAESKHPALAASKAYLAARSGRLQSRRQGGRNLINTVYNTGVRNMAVVVMRGSNDPVSTCVGPAEVEVMSRLVAGYFSRMSFNVISVNLTILPGCWDVGMNRSSVYEAAPQQNEYNTAGRAILVAAGYTLSFFQHYIWIISPGISNAWSGLGSVGGSTTWLNYGSNSVNTTDPSAPNMDVSNTGRIRWNDVGE